jgi:hypothetical protein
MSVPSETNSSNLSGKYILVRSSPTPRLIRTHCPPQNKSLSDDTDTILMLQGISWFTRKAIALASLYVTLDHKQVDGVETLINQQELTGGVGSATETRPLDWQEREVSDRLFGDVITKSRRAMIADLEPAYLKEGWEPYSVEHGVINTHGQSDTPKSGRTWVAEQVHPFFTLCAAPLTLLLLGL